MKKWTVAVIHHFVYVIYSLIIFEFRASVGYIHLFIFIVLTVIFIIGYDS